MVPIVGFHYVVNSADNEPIDEIRNPPQRYGTAITQRNGFFIKCAEYAKDAYLLPSDLKKSKSAVGTIYLLDENGINLWYAGRIYYDVEYENKLFIGLRGSHSTRDWIMDFYADSTSFTYASGDRLCRQTDFEDRTLHAGFNNLARSVVRGLEERLKFKLKRPSLEDILKNKGKYEYVFCGHSLAGAVSILSGVYFKSKLMDEGLCLENQVKAITYSAPATGNNRSRDIANKILGLENIINIYNSADIVATGTRFFYMNPGHHVKVPLLSDLSTKANSYYKIFTLFGEYMPAVILFSSYAIDIAPPLAARLGAFDEDSQLAKNIEPYYNYIRTTANFLLLLGSSSQMGALTRGIESLTQLSKCIFNFPLFNALLRPLELTGYFHQVPEPVIIARSMDAYRQQLTTENNA